MSAVTTLPGMQIWILMGVIFILLGISTFLIKMWISDIKTQGSQNEISIRQLSLHVEEENESMRQEIAQRKSEAGLLNSDLKHLEQITQLNFKLVETHNAYQKNTLEEIKRDIKEISKKS
jgi:hypothetical protein